MTIDDIVQSSEKIGESKLPIPIENSIQPQHNNDKFRGISKLTIKSKKNNG